MRTSTCLQLLLIHSPSQYAFVFRTYIYHKNHLLSTFITLTTTFISHVKKISLIPTFLLTHSRPFPYPTPISHPSPSPFRLKLTIPNRAVATARLSRPNAHAPSSITVRMLGAVGHDEFGPSLIASLQSSLIDTSSISVINGRTTGVAVILVEEGSGENRILLSPGANYSLKASTYFLN